MTVQTMASGALMVAGAALIIVAALGLLRLPDALSQANAVTKAAALGLMCLLLGALIRLPGLITFLTLAVAILVQLLTVAIAGYAVGRACYRSGARLAEQTHHDELAQRRYGHDSTGYPQSPDGR
ncbi:cation:proton antiporter [Streptomyces gobiensis]|uniref:cation:proton antiporter n=1 Tax=Streptomyces gobiensis TaxID=2875706 RepID=UPI001E369D59|nr:monovalent cation/H(+) antiporter subunit G [Streptomyces gobiensis]UGY94554.1 monovalent cation/H(+) antiporter subunit G [Streptomyces gobiensis]